MVGKDMVKNKLLHYKVLDIKIHNGKEQWKPKSRPSLVCNDDLDILNRYNSEIRGLVNYFSMAVNCCCLAHFGHIMERSMYKTFAQKYRTKVAKIRRKYNRNGLFCIRYRLKNGEMKDQTFYHDGVTRKIEPMRFMDIDNAPNPYRFKATKLVNRLKAAKCEFCGATDKLAMHHIRKLKDLKGLTPLEKNMIARKRKTIALCGNCLNNLINNE